MYFSASKIRMVSARSNRSGCDVLTIPWARQNRVRVYERIRRSRLDGAGVLCCEISEDAEDTAIKSYLQSRRRSRCTLSPGQMLRLGGELGGGDVLVEGDSRNEGGRFHQDDDLIPKLRGDARNSPNGCSWPIPSQVCCALKSYRSVNRIVNSCVI
jgi:hypothetical protein